MIGNVPHFSHAVSGYDICAVFLVTELGQPSADSWLFVRVLRIWQLPFIEIPKLNDW